MSRPLRIEYPGAWYHVMNRGAGYRNIYHEDKHRFLFLDLLSEIDRMFRVETHGYCLMDNHYHLLLHTPEGNLQRAMRHLNGVYTQRYNRSKEIDGPLFRGRYKAILIEPDAYLLNVSRYIHLNPVAGGLVHTAEDYQWSSYRNYIDNRVSPEWLKTEFVLSIVGNNRQQDQYRSFVEAGIDKETHAFFDKKKCPPVFGSDFFRELIHAKLPVEPEIPEGHKLKSIPSLPTILNAVSIVFDTPEEKILEVVRGRGKKNVARSAAVYYSRKMAGLPLNEIAKYFGLSHYGSVSGLVSRFDRLVKENVEVRQLIQNVDNIINE